jgi:tetratricopeptide (TPR) repeat protein
MIRQAVLAGLLIAFSFSVAFSADPWLGKNVFRKEGAKARVGEQEVDIELVPFPARVEDVNGEWLWLGRAWVRKSDVVLPEQAIDYLTELIRQNPSRPRYWTARGSAWHDRGKVDNAIKDYTEAIRLDPNYAKAYSNRGVALRDKRDLDSAIKDYTEAIRLDPNFAMVHANRGFARAEKGELDDAIKDCSEAIRLDPGYAKAFIFRGVAWKEKGELDHALKDCGEAIRLDPKLAWAYSIRGLIWDSKRNYDKAIADLSEAVRLDARDADACNQLAWIHATCPDEHFRNGLSAVEFAKRACELTAWQELYKIDTLAAAYAENGAFGEAVKWQRKALDLALTDSQKKELQEHLERYQARKPLRDLPKK